MPKHDNASRHFVRQRAEEPVHPDIPCIRIKIRLDYFPTEGELDYSLIAWEQPAGNLIANRIWSTYDKWHSGLAPADLVAHVLDVLKMSPEEPF